jgi:hypothetical protein
VGGVGVETWRWGIGHDELLVGNSCGIVLDVPLRLETQWFPQRSPDRISLNQVTM